MEIDKQEYEIDELVDLMILFEVDRDPHYEYDKLISLMDEVKSNLNKGISYCLIQKLQQYLKKYSTIFKHYSESYSYHDEYDRDVDNIRVLLSQSIENCTNLLLVYETLTKIDKFICNYYS